MRVLAVLAAALCFATTGTAQALTQTADSPLSVGLARVVLGGALLALVALTWRTDDGARTGRGAMAALPTGAVVAVGAVGVLAYQPTFFAGVATNGVAVGTVVALGSAPVVTGLLDGVLRRRAPRARWLLATGLALVGVVLVSGLLGGAGGAGGPGVLWSVAAGASYAAYALAGKELLERGWGPARSMGAMFGTAAAVATPALLLTRPTWLATAEGLALVLWLGVVTTAVAYLLFAWGLAGLQAPTVATLTLAEPLCAVALGVGLLGERLDGGTGAGLLVLAVGLVALVAPGRRARVPAPA